MPVDTRGVPLSLDEAIMIALQRNLDLLSGRQDPLSARASLEQERSSFDATLSLSADHQWDKSQSGNAVNSPLYLATNTSYGASVSQTLPVGTQYTLTAEGVRTRTNANRNGPTHSSDLLLSVTQPLFKGRGREAVYAGVDAAVQALAASESRLTRLVATTAQTVEKAYWTLAEAEEAERVATASLQVAESLLVRNEQLLARQLLAEVEVLTARAGVASRRSSLVTARRTRADAAEALLFAVYGEEAANQLITLRSVTPPPAYLPPADLRQMEKRALAQREDVAAARNDLEAARRQLAAAKNGLLPDVSLTGSIGTGGTARVPGDGWQDLLENEEPNWSIGAVVTIPLGKRSDKATYAANQAAYEKSRIALAAAENAVRKEIREAYRAVVLGAEELAAAEQSRQLSELQLQAEERRLELGLGDTLRVLQVETDAAQAFLTEARARYALARATLQLTIALGNWRPTVRQSTP